MPPLPPGHLERRPPRAPGAAALALAALAILATGCGDPAPAPPGEPPRSGAAVPTRTPNVVFIDVSGLRYDTVHPAEGAPSAVAAWAALTAEGSNFRSAVAPAAWETPSLACVLTGLSPDGTGVKGRAGKDRPTLIGVIDTLPEMLGGFGYESAAFTTRPLAPSGGVPRTAGLDQGFSSWAQHPGNAECGAAVAAWLTRRATESLATPQPPLFLFVHLDATRAPDDGPAPTTGTARAAYERAVASAAGALDPVLRAVTAHLGPDTLLCVFSDHGEDLGDSGQAPALERGGSAGDSSIHVPLLLRGRGFPRADVAGCCSLVDLAPTVLDAMGLPPLEGLSGSALQPLAADVRNAGRPQLSLAWRLFRGEDGPREVTVHALRTDRAKFVATFLDRPAEWTEALFDLVADPGERSPLPATDVSRFGPAFAKRVQGLREFLGGRRTYLLTDPILPGYGVR